MRAMRFLATFLCAALLTVSGCTSLPQGQPPAPPAQSTIVYPPNDGFQGQPVVETLQPGYRISRYGGYFDAAGAFRDKGNFVAPENVPFRQRALPAQARAKPFTVYEVVAPIEGVRSGPAAPWFGEPGLGIQHQLPLTIQDYLDQGKLKVISRTVPDK